jgi:2-polyprenyl-3-methyl-5-hydroxy-6-metoxy-1,4-benzoquinol methylase
MTNWTNISDNPLDSDLLRITQKFLHSKVKIEYCTQEQFVLNGCKNKSVLDIGVVEHSNELMKSNNWKHKAISQVSNYCLGIDIIEKLIDKLSNLGYNVKCVDATSDEDLKMKFDLVNIGDVIEHVNNPVDLMRFSNRHLNQDGMIIVSTPNPNFYRFLYSALVGKIYVTNLDHLRWITPCQALEIARRSNLELDQIVFFLPKSLNFFKKLLRKLRPELFSMTYYYVFKKAI